nr:unnamed protein product [Digitaria exilis]
MASWKMAVASSVRPTLQNPSSTMVERLLEPADVAETADEAVVGADGGLAPELPHCVEHLHDLGDAAALAEAGHDGRERGDAGAEPAGQHLVEGELGLVGRALAAEALHGGVEGVGVGGDGHGAEQRDGRGVVARACQRREDVVVVGDGERRRVGVVTLQEVEHLHPLLHGQLHDPPREVPGVEARRPPAPPVAVAGRSAGARVEDLRRWCRISVEGAVPVGVEGAEELGFVVVPGRRHAVARQSGGSRGWSREGAAMVGQGLQGGGGAIGEGRHARGGLGGLELVGRGQWEGGVVVEGSHGGWEACAGSEPRSRPEQMWLGSERTRERHRERLSSATRHGGVGDGEERDFCMACFLGARVLLSVDVTFGSVE